MPNTRRQFYFMRKISTGVLLLLWCQAVAGAENRAESGNQPAADTPGTERSAQTIPLDTSLTDQPEEERCVFGAETEDWMDGFRSSTHNKLCSTVLWIDGLFGDKHQFDDRSFSGKISLGFREDETEGSDPRLRVRIKARLPNVSSRLNAFIGRVEEDSYISNTEVDRDQVNAVGLRSVDDDDDEWLVGLGYRNPNNRANGFDFSVGAKLSSGLNPYAKVAHRHLFQTDPNAYWRTTQTVFWRKDDGYGVSSSLDFTKILSDRDIFEWDTSAKYTEEAEQWEWISSTAWHHSFNRKKGISSRAYVRGEDENPVSIPEFGVTFTYVQPFLRPWLLLESGIDFRWEKDEYSLDEYKSAIRVGFQLEMLLGDYYSRLQQEHRRDR